ncbi:TetR/AcrR family transcriptional regulator [Candidatus Gracilibacteria bacterium]|nr:TetR/AcrR family transcriptional regulator [Candidatus Gracilibacteria bacterium]
MTTNKTPTKERLIHSATVLFGEKGYAGVSVREICKHANTSMNMIHHFFGSKEGLLSFIVDQFNENVFSVPNKLLEKTPRSKEDFQSRIEMIFEATLETYIKERATLLVVIKEQSSSQAMLDYTELFVSFMERSKKKGFIRKKLDSEMITGLMIDRILNQVQYAPWIKKVTGDDLLNDLEYKKRWCKANLDLLLHGFLPRQ